MTAGGEIRPRANPFSTRFVRPGAIEFLFAPGDSAARMIERLAGLGRRAQIVGPHGCGKSTLLASLVESLRLAGRPARLFALHDAQRRMPRGWLAEAREARARIVAVDGYEQLSRLSRWRLSLQCRREGLALLVTSHVDVGFPTLARLAPNVEVARAIVERLLSPDAAHDAMRAAIARNSVAACFHACGGNIRETLFALYDLYERQQPACRSTPAAR